jgi:hypothetical protein
VKRPPGSQTAEELEAREAMTKDVLGVLSRSPELAFSVLIDAAGFVLAGNTEGKPASHIDIVARAIGQEIASRAHELRLAFRKVMQ